MSVEACTDRNADVVSAHHVGIDVLRAAAVALVMARHALPDLFPGAGVVGVVMFFALSGHLITHGLLAEHRRDGRIDLREFYRRRVVRLAPALVLWLIGFSVVVLCLDPLGDRTTLSATWGTALTWTANLPLPWVGESSDAAFHLWTLAGEEQFYLLWPVLLGCALARRRRVRLLLGALLACVVGLAATALWLGEAADVAYAFPTSWALCFVVGGASALFSPVVQPLATGRWIVPTASATLLALALLPVRGSWLTYTVVAPLVAVLTTLLVARARAGGVDAAGSPDLARAAVWLGRRSYAAYLWNYPVAVWLRATDLPLGVQAVVGVLLTCLLAEVSWRWVEEPAARRWGGRRRGAPAGREVRA
ncbi:acyltransferase family protein [Nocardioides yefusunii]|uniref:Acyltransferase family protein n=1 Tax=Nocardioides yefusunii TaxID=2500546 RepID=A0ABW1QW08_9ACTN|nr:acyltransferase [Nocardioides yefusunii]